MQAAKQAGPPVPSNPHHATSQTLFPLCSAPSPSGLDDAFARLVVERDGVALVLGPQALHDEEQVGQQARRLDTSTHSFLGLRLSTASTHAYADT